MKAVKYAVCVSSLAMLSAPSYAIDDVTYEVSADVAELCTLQARSAHLGTMFKDLDGTAQFARADNVLVKCGNGLDIDLTSLDAAGVLANLGNLNNIATIAAIAANGYELTFTASNADFKFTGTGTDMDFDLYAVTSPGIGSLTPAASAPLPFQSGTCAASGDGNTYSALTSGTAVNVSALPITIANADLDLPVVGTQNVPAKISAGANLIKLCYEVSQSDVDSAAVSTVTEVQYYNEFGAGGSSTSAGVNNGADADTEYNEIITVSMEL